MSQNTENIEARLCAYIDGELDAEGREEIEKHLASHPQHRKLLDELMRTKTLLTELPRAAAPSEILESMQSQLERSVLLSENAADTASAALRVSRWPQYTAAAAVVLLAVGLGAVVYFVLPDGSHQAQFSILEQPPASEPGAALLEEDLTAGLDLAATPAPAMGPESGSRESRDALETAGAAPALPVPEDLSLAAKPAETEPAANASVAPVPVDPFAESSKVVAKDENPADGSEANTMFMVVSTADASQTNEQVANFLKSNSMHWESVDEPMPNPMDPASMQRASAARLRQRILELKMNEAQQKSPEAVAGAAPTTAPAEAQANREPQQPIGEPAGEPAVAERAGEQPPVAATAAPADEAMAQQDAAPQDPAAVVSRDNYYIVRGVTKRQAAELYKQLNAEGQQRQQAAVVDEQNVAVASIVPQEQAMTSQVPGARPGANEASRQGYLEDAAKAVTLDPAAAVSEPATEGNVVVSNAPPATTQSSVVAPVEEAVTATPLASNDQILISVGDAVGPGIKTIKTQSIDADGSITLPTVGKIPAAGLTARELEAAIAQAYREVDAMGDLQIAVRKLTVAEGMIDAAVSQKQKESAEREDELARSESATQPTTAPAGQADAEADVAEAGLAEDEEKLDVVIVVQNRVAAAAAATVTEPPTTEEAPAGTAAPPASTQPTTIPVEP